MDRKTTLLEFGKYVSLSVIAMLAVSCYILADTFYVSKSLGTRGLAALNLAIPAYNFIHGTGLMLGMGLYGQLPPLPGGIPSLYGGGTSGFRGSYGASWGRRRDL